MEGVIQNEEEFRKEAKGSGFSPGQIGFLWRMVGMEKVLRIPPNEKMYYALLGEYPSIEELEKVGKV